MYMSMHYTNNHRSHEGPLLPTIRNTYIYMYIYIYIDIHTCTCMYMMSSIESMTSWTNSCLFLGERSMSIDGFFSPKRWMDTARLANPWTCRARSVFFFFFGAQLGDCDDQMWYLRKLQWWFDMD